MSVIVKTKKQALAVKAGQAYVIDTFPAADREDQEVTQKMLDDREKLETIIRENIANPKKQKTERVALKRTH